MDKKKSVIEKVVLDYGTFAHVEFEPTYVNYFFGRNGAGKTTISEMLKSNTGLVWSGGRAADDYQMLVFDQQFIRNHFSNFDDLAGVFTMNKVNIEAQARLEQLQKEKERLLEAYDKKMEAFREKEIEMDALEAERQKRMMKHTEAVRKRFALAMTGKKLARTFCPEVVKHPPVEHTEDEIAKLYAVAYEKNDRMYELLKKSDAYPGKYDLSGASLLAEPIVSTGDTQFAKVMQRLGNTDWVKEGHVRYMKKAEGICPFCHSPLDHRHFEQELRSCFDEAYQDSINAVAAFRSSYTSMAREMLRVLDGNRSTEFPYADMERYKEKLERLRAVIENNLRLVQDKVNKPAECVKLQDTAALIADIDTLVEQTNLQIQANNEACQKKRDTKKSCDRILWEHLAFLAEDDVTEYRQKSDAAAAQLASLEKEMEAIRQECQSVDTAIRSENANTVNTDEAYEGINRMLLETGFQGFSLRKKQGAQYRYEVVRGGNRPVVRLSEGERNFIAFLYFYYQVMGNGTADEHGAQGINEKIVVLDDPVNGLDTGTLSVVSTMVRDLVGTCLRQSRAGHAGFGGIRIRQMFILTHNAYFHKEASGRMATYYDSVAYFMVKKTENRSAVIPCIEKQGGRKNVAPVQDAYTALWLEYRELESAVALQQVIRRIIKHYFVEVCGYQGSSLLDILQKEKKKELMIENADGTWDDTDYRIAVSIVSDMERDAVGMGGSLLIQESFDAQRYRDVARKIFVLLGQERHYRMMLREADGTDQDVVADI